MNLKILSFNIAKGGSFNKRDNKIMQMREQIRILHPDFIFLQETFGSQFEMIAEDIWPHCRYGKNAIYTKGHHGNAILSKFPISYSENFDISMGAYENRGFLHTIAHPDSLSKPIHLICIHLGLFGVDRKKQLDKIMKYIDEKIPKEDLLILGGDFNDWNNYVSKPLLAMGLQEAFLQHKGAHAKTFPALMPILALDRIYTRGFEAFETERLTMSSWKFLSDHIAIRANLRLTME